MLLYVNMRNIVVIPIYKPQPDEAERMSLRQCVKVLGGHDMCLVCPQELDVTAYKELTGTDIRTERFAQNNFLSVETYSGLMKSNDFYKRFKHYKYILIYQLDAWVFEDKLDYWCNKGYDYVGAPWFKDWRNHEEGYDFFCVGNGGFSLRRVKTFLKATNPSQRLHEFKEVLMRHQNDKWKYYYSIKEYLSFENSLGAFMEKKKEKWEDVFFCCELKGTKLELKTPGPLEAAQFSIETSPKYIFDEINKRQLPFGCHAWQKYQYEEFWKDVIRFS